MVRVPTGHWRKPENLVVLVKEIVEKKLGKAFDELRHEDRRNALRNLSAKDFFAYGSAVYNYRGSVFGLLKAAGLVEGYALHQVDMIPVPRGTWSDKANLVFLVTKRLIPNFDKLSPEEQRERLRNLRQTDFFAYGNPISVHHGSVFGLLKAIGFAEKYGFHQVDMANVPKGVWNDKANLVFLVTKRLIPNFDKLLPEGKRNALKNLSAKDFFAYGDPLSAHHHSVFGLLKAAGLAQKFNIFPFDMKNEPLILMKKMKENLDALHKNVLRVSELVDSAKAQGAGEEKENVFFGGKEVERSFIPLHNASSDVKIRLKNEVGESVFEISPEIKLFVDVGRHFFKAVQVHPELKDKQVLRHVFHALAGNYDAVHAVGARGAFDAILEKRIAIDGVDKWLHVRVVPQGAHFRLATVYLASKPWTKLSTADHKQIAAQYQIDKNANRLKKAHHSSGGSF